MSAQVEINNIDAGQCIVPALSLVRFSDVHCGPASVSSQAILIALAVTITAR